MSRINKINYEQYALDYLEGNLSGNLLMEMQAFLFKNPDIAKELGALDLPYLTPEADVVYEDKENLLQTTPVLATKKSRKLLPVLLGLLFLGFGGIFYVQMSNENTSVNSTIDTIVDEEKNIENIIADEVIVKEELDEKELIEGAPIIKTTPKVVAKKPAFIQGSPQELSPKRKDARTPMMNDAPVQNETKQPEDNTPAKESEPIFAGTNTNTNTQGTEEKELTHEKEETIKLREETVMLAAIEYSKSSLISSPNIPMIKIPEKELSVDWTELEDEIEDNPSRLAQMGLVPEKGDRKITMRRIRNALIPETFASSK